MNGMKLIAIAVMLAAASAAFAARPEAVYVSAPNVKILSKPSESAAIVKALKEGDELDVLAEEGKFYKVKAKDGAAGFVEKADVSEKAPEKKAEGEGLDQLLGTLGGLQRTASIEESSSSHSIRGLKRDEGPGKAAISEKEAEESLEGMEKFSVSAGEADAFAREGKVGKYAK